MARGSKGNTRALLTDDEGSEPKIGSSASERFAEFLSGKRKCNIY